ncbi:MAG: Mu transposase C-terminal domain-containing protein [Lachnospiraceae bacterium]|nr:Mu transposase C-terminal domain-containing protein [Lachnospiraceae bacterium]
MACKKHNLNELRKIRETWADLPAEVVPEDKRASFVQRKSAVDMYIDGCTMSEITEATGIAHPNICRMVERCLRRDAAGDYYGYQALLKNNRTAPDEGRADGLFSRLLSQYPGLDDYIAGCWYGNKKYTLEKNMNRKSLHSRFLRKCLELGVSDYEYPFNTKNQGYASLCRYIRELDRKHIAKAATRLDRDDMQKVLSTGYGARHAMNELHPFSTVQIDGHIIDLLYSVEIVNDDGTIDRIPATRAWLIAVIDTATRCVLGYSVTQEFNYSQYDVIEALQDAILPRERPAITIDGLSYPENGGYYQTAFPELRYALYGSVMLDNAKSHLAENTVEKIVDHLGCAVNFGSVATPEARGIVERFFGTIEQRGFHRLPATTGSGIRDPKRRMPGSAAVAYEITFDEIVQLLDVLIAEYNNTPHSGIAGLTPLECMRRRIFDGGMRPTIANDEEVGVVEKLNRIAVRRIVRGGKGKRAYINYECAEYRGAELSATNEYIGRPVTLIVDPRDVSEVEAYDVDGRYIGTLKARGEFGTRSHSLKTRKGANRLARERGRETGNPFDPAVSVYERQLNEKGRAGRRDATKADIVRREAGRGTSTVSGARTGNSEDIVPIKPRPEFEGMTTDEFAKAVWGNKL